MLTQAIVNIIIQNNATWEDAFQFEPPDTEDGGTLDTSWSFTGQTFRLDVKTNATDTTPKLSMTTANGQIVVDDPVQRILHFNVPDSFITANLPVGKYVYDLIMIDASNPPIRVALMSGTVTVNQGVTGN